MTDENLSVTTFRTHGRFTDAVTLPPDLVRFAEEAIAAGRFRDVAEVVRAGVSLLRQAEAEREQFVASLRQAQAEGRQHGFRTIDQVMADLDVLIEGMDDARA